MNTLFTKANYLNGLEGSKQRGAALIVVLLIMALVTILAVEMNARQQISIARAVNIKTNNQAYWYALGAEEFAKSSLITLQSLTGDNINLSQPWAQAFQYPIEGGIIEALITDMQSCFNINAISSAFDGEDPSEPEQEGDPNPNPAPDPNPIENDNRQAGKASQEAFETLLNKFTEDNYLAEVIRDSVIDWIDEDDRVSQLGAEDADYESLIIPYLPANSPMTHISELRLVNGIDQSIKAGWLADFQELVCVIPESSLKINVNTITEERAMLLDALLGPTADVAASIISARPEEGFDDINDFFSLSEIENLQIPAEKRSWFDITTQYFKLDTRAKFQESQFKMSTVFRVDDGGVTIISREFGGAF